MKKLFTNYNWLIKFIGAALLIAFGLVVKFIEGSEGFITILAGFIIVIASLFRVIPLMKTLHREILRTINLIEIIANVIIGGFLLYWGFSGQSSLGNLFGYLIGAILYARGLIFFVSTVLLGEKSEQPKFWFHLAALTLAVFMITRGNISPDTFAWLILFVSVGIGAYLAFDGGGGYKRYRYEVAQRKATEDVKIKTVVEAPSIGKKEEVPMEEPKKDQPTVQ
jgi:hypothetical protein